MQKYIIANIVIHVCANKDYKWIRMTIIFLSSVLCVFRFLIILITELSMMNEYSKSEYVRYETIINLVIYIYTTLKIT